MPTRQTSLFIMKQGRGSEPTEAVVCLESKTPLQNGVLYDSDFHKPGIYGSGRVWANAWQAFRRTPSRDVGGRRAAVDFVVCFECGGVYFVFSMIGFAFSNSCTRPLAARVQRRLGEETTTASQSSHRELRPTDPHQVYHLLCSHLRVMASSVDQ